MPRLVDHPSRRAEISAAAASLIAAGGLEAATIREIARSSGFSKGVVEHYFDSKDELIGGALAWANAQYEQRVGRATRNQSGLAALRQRIAATLPMNKVIRDEWKVRLVFWSMAAIDPELRQQQARRLRRAVQSFQADIEAAMVAAEIPSNGDAAQQSRHLVNMTTGISTAALHNPRLYTRACLRKEVDYLLARLAQGF